MDDANANTNEGKEERGMKDVSRQHALLVGIAETSRQYTLFGVY